MSARFLVTTFLISTFAIALNAETGTALLESPKSPAAISAMKEYESASRTADDAWSLLRRGLTRRVFAF